MLGAVSLLMPPGAAQAQNAAALPLSANGPYLIGRQEFTFVDASRDRTLTGYIFYPSGQNANPSRPLVHRNDAPPDTSAAPYPLVFYSHPRSGDGVDATATLGAAPLLASYGFAVVSIQHNDPPLPEGWLNLIQRPMDIVFVLNQLEAASGEGGIASLIDFAHVGITGFSFGGWTALQFSGAQIDPASRAAYCTTVTQVGDSVCDISDEVWQQIVNLHAQFDPSTAEGGLWSPYADRRIIAVMPVAPCWGPLLGERGLASATVPTLIVGLERDERCPYERDALFMYDHLGAADRALLTVSRQGHADAIFNRDPQKIFNHFSVAFFGLHLMGITDYAQYLTADAVKGFDNLAWASPTG